MQIAESLAAAIDTLTRRTVDRARDLKVDGRLATLEQIAAREHQLAELLGEVPGGLLGCLRGALKASNTAPTGASLELLFAQLLSAYDQLGKRIVQLPTPPRIKLSKEHAEPIAQSRIRIKRLIREGRGQVQQRILQHTAKQREASEQRRAELRTAHANHRTAERKTELRARAIWIGMLLSILTAMAAIVLWR
jgi:hypothetical protein